MRRKVIFLLVVILLTAGTEAAFAGQSVTEPQENNFVTEYQVSPGDSLTAIAKRHEMDWELVAAMNNIDNPNKIYPGQQLFLPVMQQDHVVVGHGDTLWAIAQKFEVNVSDLAFENAIENPNALEAGMRLRIPSMPAIPTFLQDEVVPALSSRGATDFFLSWPLIGVITSPYGRRGNDFHHGIDLSGKDSDTILAAAAGKVTFSGWLNSVYGQTVIITHNHKYRTLYAHNRGNLVEKGDRVTVGQPIALQGSSGRATGPHLHLEVYRDGSPVNPLELLP